MCDEHAARHTRGSDCQRIRIEKAFGIFGAHEMRRNYEPKSKGGRMKFEEIKLLAAYSTNLLFFLNFHLRSSHRLSTVYSILQLFRRGAFAETCRTQQVNQGRTRRR